MGLSGVACGMGYLSWMKRRKGVGVFWRKLRGVRVARTHGAALAGLAILAGFGCEASPAPASTSRDSLGVRIVESVSPPAWSARIRPGGSTRRPWLIFWRAAREKSVSLTACGTYCAQPMVASSSATELQVKCACTIRGGDSFARLAGRATGRANSAISRRWSCCAVAGWWPRTSPWADETRSSTWTPGWSPRFGDHGWWMRFASPSLPTSCGESTICRHCLWRGTLRGCSGRWLRLFGYPTTALRVERSQRFPATRSSSPRTPMRYRSCSEGSTRLRRATVNLWLGLLTGWSTRSWMARQATFA